MSYAASKVFSKVQDSQNNFKIDTKMEPPGSPKIPQWKPKFANFYKKCLPKPIQKKIQSKEDLLSLLVGKPQSSLYLVCPNKAGVKLTNNKNIFSLAGKINTPFLVGENLFFYIPFCTYSSNLFV